MSYPNPNPTLTLGHNFIAPESISYRNLYQNVVRGDTLTYNTIMSYNNPHIVILVELNILWNMAFIVDNPWAIAIHSSVFYHINVQGIPFLF